MTVDMKDINSIRKHNQQVQDAMAEQGYGIEAGPLLKLRLDLITDVLVELGVVEESTLEMRWEIMVLNLLHQAQAELARLEPEEREVVQ
jgi:hypothetical protein